MSEEKEDQDFKRKWRDTYDEEIRIALYGRGEFDGRNV